MLGNAAKIVAVKRLIIANSACEVVADLELPIVKVARQFVLGFEDEVTGRIPPSHPKLLTGIVFDDKTIKARATSSIIIFIAFLRRSFLDFLKSTPFFRLSFQNFLITYPASLILFKLKMADASSRSNSLFFLNLTDK